MSRNPKRDWSATLPGGIPIEGILPDSLIARRALELVTGHNSMPVEAVVQKAMANQLRLCIQKIGGREVSWSKLRGKLLDHFLDPKQQHLIRRMFQQLTDPSEAEVKFMHDSLAIENDDGEWAWSGKMLCGEALDAWIDANEKRAEAEALLEMDPDDEDGALRRFEEAVAALDGANEKAITVHGTIPNTNVIQRAIEQIPAEARKKPALSRKESSENLVRLCITEIAGTAVGFSELKGTGIDTWLHPKEQTLIAHALMELGTPQAEEEADFLATITQG